MSTFMRPAYAQRFLGEVADRYIRRGFSVEVEPPQHRLPDFLQGFYPDLLATTPDEHIFVEVKGSGKTYAVDYWERLQEAIKSHPGWRMELIVNNHREEELVEASRPLYSEHDIDERLRAGQRLAKRGLHDSALLVVWSALEAILRRLSQAKRLELPNETPATLITLLTSEGVLDRDDYDVLIKTLPLRNQVAHGHQAENIADVFARVRKIAARLFREQSTKKIAA